MILYKIDQNTEEWEEFRKGKSGGSAFGKLYKTSGVNSGTRDQFFTMLAERVARPMTPNDYEDRVPAGVPFSWAVRGHILEPEAAKLFEERYKKPLMDGYVWISDYDYNSYVSPDRAILGDNGQITEAVEIKCLSSEKVLKVWWDRMHLKEGEVEFDVIPGNDYKAQVIKYFLVNEELQKLYWVLYTDLIPNLELQVLEVKREDVEKYLPAAKDVEKRYLDELKKAEKMLEENS